MSKRQSKASMALNRQLGRLIGPIMTRQIYPRRFCNPPDPVKHLWINPEMIAGWYPGSRFKEISFPGKIKRGDWYRMVRPKDLVFSIPHNKINSTIAHFRDGVPWIDTGLFRKRYSRHLDSRKLDAQAKEYEKYDRLFSAIQATGFQAPSAESGIAPMFIHIGPAGEIFWTADGNHRLAMAILLHAEVPVIVLNRHPRWQEVRDKALMDPEALSAELLIHPDLSDVIITTETGNGNIHSVL